MIYNNIPSANQGVSDTPFIRGHRPELNDQIIKGIDKILKLYPKAFSSMAKRNLLTDLERYCEAWKPPKKPSLAMDALRKVVQKEASFISQFTLFTSSGAQLLEYKYA